MTDLDKVYTAQALSSMAGGLGLAKTICRRKLLEANHMTGEQHLILSIISEISALMDHADKEISKLGSHSG